VPARFLSFKEQDPIRRLIMSLENVDCESQP
jgi:hypothetical protein